MPRAAHMLRVVSVLRKDLSRPSARVVGQPWGCLHQQEVKAKAEFQTTWISAEPFNKT